MATYTWPTALKINSDWNDTTTIAVTSNTPEIGAPIRRLRSRNVKHTLSITFIVTLTEYTSTFLTFLQNINGGVDSFNFPDLLNSGSTVSYIDAYIDDPTKPYTIKRQDRSTYTISMSISYYKVGTI